MILNVLALVVSGVALASSVGVAIRQLKLQKHANYTPLVLEFVCAFRSQKLYDDLVYVLKKLAFEHQPTAGISDLPEAARSAVLNIAYYYQAFAWLDDAGAIDDKDILQISRQRIVSTWEAIGPFVQAERAMVGGPLLTKLEAHSQKLSSPLLRSGIRGLWPHSRRQARMPISGSLKWQKRSSGSGQLAEDK